MNARSLASLLVALLVGCGPTYTAGTRGVAARDLAVLSIPQLPEAAYVRIRAIQFDDAGDQYEVGDGRDFYLLPGDHTASVTLIAPVPGPAGWFVPSSALTFPGPKRLPLGTVTAGKSYELAPSVEGFGQLLQGGRLSLVREKVN